MKQSIAVIGQGFVGGSLTTVFAERGFDVHVFDKAGKVAPNATPFRYFPEINEGSNGKVRNITNLVYACESLGRGFKNVYFVCLPTPMCEDGSCDLTIVEGALRELASAPGISGRIAVVKSTVPPGSTERWNEEFKSLNLRVIFNPEFLREASALDDMRNQNRVVLGGPRPYINRVKQIFESAFPNVPIIKTSSTTAEMVKYVSNVHLAVKVSLANEFYQICEALDSRGANIDYDKVIEYATLDERLGKSHWKVPGPMPSDDTGEPAYGYGGSCFVKDINSLIFLARELGIDPKVMLGSWNKNIEVRPQKDWLRLVGRAVSKK